VERKFCELNPYPSHRKEEYPTFPTLGTATFGQWVGIVIWFGVISTILGACGVYLDFIGHEVSGLVGASSFTQTHVMLIVAIPLIALSWLRSFKLLVHTSLFGDVAVTAGIIAVLVYGFDINGLPNPGDLKAFKPDTFSEFFGPAVFLFAIHVVVLPISQSMKEPTEFPKVVNWSFIVILIINGIFGFFGYLLYGEQVKGLVIDNVNGPLGDVVKVMLCFDLFFTVPILLTAPREIIEGKIMSYWGNEHKVAKENVIRSCIVLVFLLLALAIPNINDLATLVGCVVSPVMAFILPPLLHMHYNRDSMPGYSIILHWAIVVFGAFAGVYTTYYQAKSMVDGN